MTIFAVYNIKGGVGKTTSAVNLAYLSAAEGAETLVWDLDPQGAATYCFRIRPRVKGGRKGLVRGKRPVDDHIKGTDHERLDLLPADFSYRKMDLSLNETKKPTQQYRQILAPLRDEYDNIFLDCPPGITLSAENVFDVADVLLVPVIPAALSLRMLDQVTDFLKKRKLHKRIRVLPFYTMVDRRKKLHQTLVAAPPPQFLSTYVPYAAVVEQMPLERRPLADYAGRSPATAAYDAIWREVAERIG